MNDDAAMLFTWFGLAVASAAVVLSIARFPGPTIGGLAFGLVVGWALCRRFGPSIDQWRARGRDDGGS